MWVFSASWGYFGMKLKISLDYLRVPNSGVLQSILKIQFEN